MTKADQIKRFYGGRMGKLTNGQKRVLLKIKKYEPEEYFTADDIGEKVTILFKLCKSGHLKCFNIRPEFDFSSPLYILQCTLKFYRIDK